MTDMPITRAAEGPRAPRAMRRVAIAVLAVVAALAGLLAASPAATAEPSASTPPPPVAEPAVSVSLALSGRVMFDDGKPAREGKVDLVAVGREDARSWTFSDLHGRWQLGGVVPAGAYQLRFQLSDGDWFWYPGTQDRDEADVFTVTGETTAGLDVTWPPPARVRATVLDPDGRPLSGVCLDATRIARCSKADGVLTLPDVEAGTLRVTGWSRSARWYVPETPIVTRRSSLVEVTLRALPTAAIRGVLRDDDGRALQRACPDAFEVDGTEPLEHLRVRCSASDGRWQLSGLPAGRFRVRLSLGGDEGVSTVWWPTAAAAPSARTVVAESGRVTDDGTVTLPPLGSLAGKVLDSSGEPVAGAWVQLGPPDLTRPDGIGADHSATTGPDGHFRIDGVAAWTAPVVVTVPGTAYGTTWSGDAPRATQAQPVTITWGRTTRLNVAVLPQAPLSVTLTGDLVPGDSYRVEAVDEVGNPVGFPLALDSDRPTGTVRGLAAGAVRLRVVHEPVGPGAVADPVRYYPAASDPGSAQAVTVEASGTTIVWALR